MDFWITLLQFIGAIVALIIVHEFGHFVVARLVKVEVEEFGIGFPPRIAKLFKAWGTQFTLNAIPFGGFVRFKGGDYDPTIPGSLAAANPWARLAVLFAGPVANLLVAVLLYATIFSRVGTPDYSKVQLMAVVDQSPAAQAGLQPGDIILKFNDEQIDNSDELHDLISSHRGQQVTLVYQRGDQVNQVSLTPRVQFSPKEGSVGILMGNPYRETNWIQSLPYGFLATYNHSRLLLQLPFDIFSGQTDPGEGRLVGFKGMFDIYQEVREEPVDPAVPTVVNSLLFFTQITISLGLFNLIPFPALDGGRILFTLPEIIIRRRVPPQYENVINLIGFGLLLMLLIYVNLQDFLSPAVIP